MQATRQVNSNCSLSFRCYLNWQDGLRLRACEEAVAYLCARKTMSGAGEKKHNTLQWRSPRERGRGIHVAQPDGQLTAKLSITSGFTRPNSWAPMCVADGPFHTLSSACKSQGAL